jgi:hypothetical protein
MARPAALITIELVLVLASWQNLLDDIL